MENFVVFQMCILQRTRNVKRARDIKKRILKRLDAWEAGKYTMLVQDTVTQNEIWMPSSLNTRAEGKDLPSDGNSRRTASHGQIFDRQGKGSILMPGDIDEKTGDSVATVLESKHPDARVPNVSLLPTYSETPHFFEKVARRLSGSSGVGGTDARMAHACTRYEYPVLKIEPL
jgi:hypothetical protein